MKKWVRLLFVFINIIIMTVLFSASVNAAELIEPDIIDVSSSAKTVTICWDEMQSASGYKIYSETKDGKKKSAGTTEDTYYTVKKLSPDTSYKFYIRAYTKDENGKKIYGPYSEKISVKTTLPTVQKLSFKKADTKSITLSWEKVQGATEYKVYFAKDEAYKFALAGKTSKTYFKTENLDGSSKWKFKVVALNKNNKSPDSDVVKFYTVPEKTPVPEAASVSVNSVKIKWKKTGSANKYEVYFATKADGKYKLLTTTTKTTYTYKDVYPGKKCFFKVKPLLVTKNQNLKGTASGVLKVTVKDIEIILPSVIRKGEYPEITVPHYKNIKWTTSDKKVMKLKGSRLFAAGEGTVVLTATYKDKYKKSVTVTVGAPTLKYMSVFYDVTKGRTVFENRINERCYPASITKLITALVTLKYMDEDDVIVVGDELNMVEALSSRCGISKGEKFKLKDILYGLLLPSGGDAAYTIAVNVARKVSGNPNMGYVAAKNYFVSMMNKYMKSIGATGTNCVNPHGYPVDGHYSTVHDLLLVAQEVLKNDTLKSITSTSYKYVTAITGKGRSWRTTNSLISSGAYYYSSYSHGMKTGTVNDNYTGIISAATKEGRTIITIVIGTPSYNARYEATHKLYNTYL